MALNPLPYREVKRKLEAAGFIEVSQKGSHVKFVKYTDEGIRTKVLRGKNGLLPQPPTLTKNRLEASSSNNI